MKLYKLFALPLLSISLLTGCPGGDNKVSLHYGSYETMTTTVLSYDDLATKIDNKESFIAVVSPGHAGCMCWVDFKEILVNVIKEKHIIVYEINYNSFFDASNNRLNSFGLDIRKDMETFSLFNKGSLSKQEVYSSDRSIFKQETSFKEYLDQSVNYPMMYYVSLDQLDSIYASKQKAVIYFARNNCPDCQSVDKDFLFNYSDNHLSSNKMYILDGENIGIREYDEQGRLTPESSEKWQEFKDKYGLSKKNNAKYGYGDGVVPTFQLIEGNDTSYASSILSSSVYYNDTVSNVDGQYVVTDSFYSEERKADLQFLEKVETKVLKGMTLSADDVNVKTYGELTFCSWKKESAAKYHSPLLEAFLDYALPMANHSF